MKRGFPPICVIVIFLEKNLKIVLWSSKNYSTVLVVFNQSRSTRKRRNNKNYRFFSADYQKSNLSTYVCLYKEIKKSAKRTETKIYDRKVGQTPQGQDDSFIGRIAWRFSTVSTLLQVQINNTPLSKQLLPSKIIGERLCST